MTVNGPTERTAALEQRVLILAPIGRDAELARAALAAAGLMPQCVADIDALCREIGRGAGSAVLTIDALVGGGTHALLAQLDTEPTWSDLPLIIMTDARQPTARAYQDLRRLERRSQVTFLERPVRVMTLISTIRAALESRRRQYTVRALLADLADDMRRRDEFLATLGHELRNPLGAIRSAVDLLKFTQTPGTTAGLAIKVLERQTHHMSRIFDDLLDISRVTRGKVELRMEQINLAACARRAIDVVRHLIEERHQQLRVELPKAPVWVTADPTRIEQIIWNLLGNAAKFTDADGSIELSVTAEDQQAEVRVRDTGCGMTQEFIERAFDMFAQASIGNGGLGLGLTLSRHLAVMHGGTLTASSDGPQRGSTFVLRLPLSRELPEAIPDEGVADAGASPCRVLLVEDNADIAAALPVLLQQMGHTVEVANNGAEALQLVSAYRPDVILLDIGLPDMNGRDVARQIRADRTLSNTYIVAISGFGQSSDRQLNLDAGCDEHVTKPVTLKKLTELLARCRRSDDTVGSVRADGAPGEQETG